MLLICQHKLYLTSLLVKPSYSKQVDYERTNLCCELWSNISSTPSVIEWGNQCGNKYEGCNRNVCKRVSRVTGLLPAPSVAHPLPLGIKTTFNVKVHSLHSAACKGEFVFFWRLWVALFNLKMYYLRCQRI